MVYPVILCGGQGTRLWPISNKAVPKQFIDFFDKKSLLQISVERFTKLKFTYKPYIVTSYNHKFIVEKQLEEIDTISAEIILEPTAKSTAAAITLAALSISEADPDSLMLVSTVDSWITDCAEFKHTIEVAIKAAKECNKLISVGIKPRHSETAFGYIKPGKVLSGYDMAISKIIQFFEKPHELDAVKYIDEGFIWNSGIFVAPVKFFIQEMRKYSNDVLHACINSLVKSHNHLSSNSRYNISYIDYKEFEKCPIISIDLALMEKTCSAYVIQSNINWCDIGSWKDMHLTHLNDTDGNFTTKRCISIDNKNVQIYATDESKLRVALNLQDITIVDSADALLVMDTKYAQNLKSIVNKFGLTAEPIKVTDTLVQTKWGSYEILLKSKRVAVKKIIINPGQSYKNCGSSKLKYFIVLRGSISFISSRTSKIITIGQFICLNAATRYRIENKINNISAEAIKIEL